LDICHEAYSYNQLSDSLSEISYYVMHGNSTNGKHQMGLDEASNRYHMEIIKKMG